MKQTFFSSLFFLFSLLSVLAQDSKKVLFLGNSYTSCNNLPLMVSEMAVSIGDELIYNSNTPGGYTMMAHSTDSTTLNLINANNWDYVVLQAQSRETSLEQEQMEKELFPFTESLSTEVRENCKSSQLIFYMTWGRENGDTPNCFARPWVCTYEGMDDVIQKVYTDMARTNKAEISPVGAVWRELRANHPDIKLYSKDGSHPSLAGSYVAACTFYTMIYKKDPIAINWNSSLPETEVEIIKKVVKSIVFNKIANWDFTNN